MKRLIAAIGFITFLPIGRKTVYDPVGMIPFFPVVGLLLGAILAGIDAAAGLFWEIPVASLIDVAALVLLTGALHLDGLGDTADGLFGHHDRPRALAIMKDSRVGAMGLVAVVLGLTLKWAGIWGLDSHRSLCLLLVPTYARGAMIFAIRFLEYGRPEGGTGHPLFSAPLPAASFAGVLLPVAASFFAGALAIRLNLAFVIFTAAVILFYRRRIGCVTGDMLGAMVEATEVFLFLVLAAGGGR
ncbi:MAG: adenosylcobinamide-GDP ribazoletransferase [Desulfobacterales bacterium]|nr:adenosylcobinamide-GDP ribazoletransferase [Desulfobacterales bacterium]